MITKEQLYDIAQGWAKVGLDELGLLPEESRLIAETRIRHCESCSIRTEMKCDTNKFGPNVQTGVVSKGCGCALKAKVLSTNSKCPLGKW